MKCSAAREALSARLDGESEPVPSHRVDVHLAACDECCAWHAAASEVDRALRAGSSRRSPDLAGRILAGVGVDVPRTPVARVARWVTHDHPWRTTLGSLGVVQTALGVLLVFGVDLGALAMGPRTGDVSAHLSNESAAWNLAVGVGFLVAAARPHLAGGLIPVLAVFAGVLAVFVVSDATTGAVTLARAASHVVLVVGLGVVAMVHRRYPVYPAQPPAWSVADVVPPGARLGRSRTHLRDVAGPAA